jgi:hypothetical protein
MLRCVRERAKGHANIPQLVHPGSRCLTPGTALADAAAFSSTMIQDRGNAACHVVVPQCGKANCSFIQCRENTKAIPEESHRNERRVERYRTETVEMRFERYRTDRQTDWKIRRSGRFQTDPTVLSVSPI